MVLDDKNVRRRFRASNYQVIKLDFLLANLYIYLPMIIYLFIFQLVDNPCEALHLYYAHAFG